MNQIIIILVSTKIMFRFFTYDPVCIQFAGLRFSKNMDDIKLHSSFFH